MAYTDKLLLTEVIKKMYLNNKICYNQILFGREIDLKDPVVINSIITDPTLSDPNFKYKMDELYNLHKLKKEVNLTQLKYLDLALDVDNTIRVIENSNDSFDVKIWKFWDLYNLMNMMINGYNREIKESKKIDEAHFLQRISELKK